MKEEAWQTSTCSLGHHSNKLHLDMGQIMPMYSNIHTLSYTFYYCTHMMTNYHMKSTFVSDYSTFCLCNKTLGV